MKDRIASRFPRATTKRKRLHSLEDNGDSLSSSDASSSDSVSLLPILKSVRQGSNDPRSRGSEGMSDGDGSSEEVLD